MRTSIDDRLTLLDRPADRERARRVKASARRPHEDAEEEDHRREEDGRRAAVEADRWGAVQVRSSSVKKTTIVGKGEEGEAQVDRRSTCTVYPTTPIARVYINEQALPLLAQEALQAQSAEDRHDLGRDVHERRVRRSRCRRDREGRQGLSRWPPSLPASAASST